MEAIQNLFDKLEIGETVTYRNLSITPICSDEQGSPGYLVLDEALKLNLISVTEISASGNVPELKFTNHSKQPVLLVDGEELVGAKQNRILNLTVMAPPEETIIIPVSCVEAGRWSQVSEEFYSRGRTYFAAGRARKAAQVSDSLRMNMSRRSRQGEIWDDIARKVDRMACHSATSEMGCLYEGHQDQVDDYLQSFSVSEKQIGAVFSIRGQVRGIELFDYPKSFAKLMPKIVRSYALDALEEPETNFGPVDGITEFINSIKQARCDSHTALGEGVDIRLSGPDLVGGALSVGDRIVHLCAFRLQDSRVRADGSDGGLIRSQRRMHHYQSRGHNPRRRDGTQG